MTAWTQVMGWTLLHFVWQGAALATAAAVALWLCRHRSADARYAIACVALVAMLAVPALTARILLTPAVAPAVAADAARSMPVSSLVPSLAGSWPPVRSQSWVALWAGLDAVLPGLVFSWVVGVAFFTLRMTGGLWHVRRLMVRSLATEASRWQAAANRIATRVGLRRRVHVVDMPTIETPMAIGWLRPVVLLPIAALANLTPSQVEAILAHELIHIRRHDFAVNVAQTVAETLLFFHPGVWWVSGRIRVEREHCCDDATVDVCGDPIDYAAALAELEAWRSQGTSLALAATGAPLTVRIRRMLRVPTGRAPRSWSWVLTAALAGMLSVSTGGAYMSSLVSTSGMLAPLPGRQAGAPVALPGAFDWRVHRTAHFEIHYYPALARDLEPVADAAERAYRRISGALQQDLSFRVPLILFKTRSEFAQQGIAPEANDAIRRGVVTAFTEPERNRIVVLIEEFQDRLERQLTHELSHVFAFEVIPRSGTDQRHVPAWVDEGFAEYMTGAWSMPALDHLRDMVATDRVPRVSTLTADVNIEALGGVANLGHAVFEFIEAEYGKAAVWQFLLEVRRQVLGGTDHPFHGAFNRTPAEFDAAFRAYLDNRFR